MVLLCFLVRFHNSPNKGSTRELNNVYFFFIHSQFSIHSVTSLNKGKLKNYGTGASSFSGQIPKLVWLPVPGCFYLSFLVWEITEFWYGKDTHQVLCLLYSSHLIYVWFNIVYIQATRF